MRKKGKIALVVAAVAAAALITTSAVFTSSNGATLASGEMIQAEQTDLRALLLPTAQLPPGDVIELTLAQMTSQWRSILPTGMVFSPTSCAAYLGIAIPNLSSLNGWVQANDRGAASFNENDWFLNLVAEVPGGVNLDNIKAAATTCSSGTVSLNSKVVGAVSITQVPAAPLAGASTLGLSNRVTFEPTNDPATKEVLASYGYVDLFQAIHGIFFSLIGTTLFMAMAPDAHVAEQRIEAMYQRAIEAGVS